MSAMPRKRKQVLSIRGRDGPSRSKPELSTQPHFFSSGNLSLRERYDLCGAFGSLAALDTNLSCLLSRF
jgi:hypothetical protein